MFLLFLRELCYYDFKATFLEKYSEIATNLLPLVALLIAQNWKENRPPLLIDWLGKLWHVFLLNKLTAIAHFDAGDLRAFDRFWKQWSIYVLAVGRQGSDNNIRNQILELL